MEKNDPQETNKHEMKITTTGLAGKSSSPRQPNERDASPDNPPGPPRADMQQAAIDIASGQVNTDLYGQPAKNPKNNRLTTPSPLPDSTQKLPDGREK